MTKSVRSTPTLFDFNSFQGFAYPNTTQVPDLLFDQIMQDLDEKELKVLLYIIRRTFGFKKPADNISLSQLVNGIITHDGRVLDRGTGLSKASVTRALHALKQKNLINATQNRNAKKGNLPTTYSLRMSPDPCLTVETRVVSPQKQALVSRLRHTTYSNTTNSKTAATATIKSAKSDGSSSNKGELAAALIDKGIDERTAKNLVKEYDKQRVENNLDWLEWKQNNNPHAIKTNPAGLLRRAIEQDYAAENHKNFQTRQQKAAASLAQKQRLQAQERLVDAHKRQQAATLQQRETARAKRLEKLREIHHTGEQTDRLWSHIMTNLKSQVPDISFKAYLAASSLLAIRADRAVIAVPNRFVKGWLEARLSKKIQRALNQHLKVPVVTIEYLPLDE